MLAAIGKFQVYPSGLAVLDPNTVQEPYVEQVGVRAMAVKTLGSRTIGVQ